MRRTTLVWAMSLVGMALSVSGCTDDESGPGGGGTQGGCADYASATGSPSFATDVIPIFALSCALSNSCHQLPATSAMEGLALGRPMSMLPLSQADLDAVHTALISTAAIRSQLPLVEPSNPAGSWLMGKVEYVGDASQGTTYAECDANTLCGDTCGDPMPLNGGRMDQGRIDTIAAWIKDGAQNN